MHLTKGGRYVIMSRKAIAVFALVMLIGLLTIAGAGEFPPVSGKSLCKPLHRFRSRGFRMY